MNAKEKTKFSEKTSPQMFDRIAKRYDKLNRVMTFGLDKTWRKAITRSMPPSINHWLDAATGTGDQILFCLESKLLAEKITGIDLSSEMLLIGKKKLAPFPNVELINASMALIPLESESCDVVSCSFGIRNIAPFTDALIEFFRVLKSGGTLLILESSRPSNPLLRLGHRFYMKKILPKLAFVLGSDPKAYTYLADTTSKFPCGVAFATVLKEMGFVDVSITPMTFGSVTLYHAKKP